MGMGPWFLCLLVPVFFLLLVAPARADYSLPDVVTADSVSGQFVVTGLPEFSGLAFLPEVETNPDIVRLEPALLAVSAERVRDLLMDKLGVGPNAPWSGKIFLSLHPARSLNETVDVFPTRFENGWIYRVLLPDVMPRERLVRTLTSVLLLEYANRTAAQRSAQVPSWLVEGFSQELLAEDWEGLVLTAPGQTVNGVPVNRLNFIERGMDPLAGARATLQTYSVLTFAQLSWPTAAQLAGEDGGVYRASSQLFVNELLDLPGGPARLRAMLRLLPRYYNWQTAFESAFHKEFSTPLKVEKWWALQSVIFDARSPGPQWTAPVSREKLDEILSVAVDYRSSSNSLPIPAAVSLQEVIRNFNTKWQSEILGLKLRDLEIAQFRIAPSLAPLTAEYRDVLAAYLGETPITRRVVISRKISDTPPSARETIRKLDALDAQRRSLAMARQ